MTWFLFFEYILIFFSIALGLGFIVGILWLYYQWHLNIYAWALGLARPSHRVRVEYNVLIPISDGVMLVGDVYHPKGSGKQPTIIIRTPYGKGNKEHSYPLIASIFCSQGYNVLIQDVRGKYGSEGVFQPFINEERDGKETIEWVCRQEWSNGKVGMFGFSYLGTCAWLASSNGPEALKAIVPLFCCQNAYTAWVDRGVPYLKDILFWLSKHHGRKGRLISHEEIDQMILLLPVLQFDQRIKDGIDTFKTWMEHLEDDDYWRSFSISPRRETITVPALFFGGWFDRFVSNTINDFFKTLKATTSTAAKKSRMVIGPWAHQPTELFLEMDFGKESYFRAYIAEFVHWFDVWLKGKDYDFDNRYPIRYFMMGKNEWRHTATWPPIGFREKKFYLSSNGRANTFYGDGELLEGSRELPSSDEYVYDPENPTPTMGNKMLYGNKTDGPREQSRLYRRHDILFYHTKKFDQALELAGPVEVVLYVSSSAKDTDFCAKLCDVHPDGKSYFLLSGFVRMRFLDSVKATHGIEAGRVYRIALNLGDTAHTFLQGHRMQLQICSADFPNHERNLNTGGSNEGDSDEIKAFETIHHGGSFDAHLSLPVSLT